MRYKVVEEKDKRNESIYFVFYKKAWYKSWRMVAENKNWFSHFNSIEDANKYIVKLQIENPKVSFWDKEIKPYMLTIIFFISAFCIIASGYLCYLYPAYNLWILFLLFVPALGAISVSAFILTHNTMAKNDRRK